MGRTFRVYLPHTILPLYQLLATHPSCVGFSYIEEGIVAYRPNSEVKNCIPAMIPNLSGIQKWVMRGRWDMEWPFDKRAEAAYGFSSSSFSTIGVPVVVQEPNWSVSSDLAKRYDHSVLCILGPARTLVKSSWNPEQYYWMIMQLAEILVHTDRKIFVRFHPDQKDDERRLILRLFNEKIPGAEVASDEDQAEAICASADVVIVQAGSSVGLYADQLGKPVYGYLDLMQEIAPRAVQSWVDTRSQMSYSFRERDIRTFGN
ncbi:MAG: hypothetical protein IPF95_17080 [Flavobacteriales bacterium]|nr:hypothetical protein [Flavobacteriales bacterium]